VLLVKTDAVDLMHPGYLRSPLLTQYPGGQPRQVYRSMGSATAKQMSPYLMLSICPSTMTLHMFLVPLVLDKCFTPQTN